MIDWMNPREDTSVKTYIELYREGLAIMVSLPSLVREEALKREVSGKLNSEEQVGWAEIEATKNLIIDRAITVSSFLSKEFTRADNEDFHVLVVYLRVLVDVYARLLFITSEPYERVLKVLIADRFLTLAKFIKGASTPADDIVFHYKSYRTSVMELLKTTGLEIPENPLEISKKRLKEQGATYPPTDQMLLEQVIKKYAPGTTSIWKNTSSTVYDTYSKFSDFVHPNPITGHQSGNEILWVLTVGIINMSLIIETINVGTINNSLDTKIKSWHEKISLEIPKLTEFWVKLRKSKGLQ